MARKLAANVYVGETLYKKDTTPPKEIADQITNPKAWGDGTADAADSDTGGDAGGTNYGDMSVAKLKAEIKERNESRSDEATHIKPAGTKQADLVAALVADDEAAAGGE